MADLSPRNHIRVEVDRALCIGSGDCGDTAPDVFPLEQLSADAMLAALSQPAPRSV